MLSLGLIVNPIAWLVGSEVCHRLDTCCTCPAEVLAHGGVAGSFTYRLVAASDNSSHCILRSSKFSLLLNGFKTLGQILFSSGDVFFFSLA